MTASGRRPFKRAWSGVPHLQDGRHEPKRKGLSLHEVPEKWDNVMPFVLLSALEVKNTKGHLVISAALPVLKVSCART